MSENKLPPIPICLMIGFAVAVWQSQDSEMPNAPTEESPAIELDNEIELSYQKHDFPHYTEYTNQSSASIRRNPTATEDSSNAVAIANGGQRIATGSVYTNQATGLGDSHSYLNSYWNQVDASVSIPGVRVEADIQMNHPNFGLISPPGYFDSKSNTVVLETQVSGTDPVSAYVRAHEVGHSIQMQQAGGNHIFATPGILIEQQADCYAGASIAYGVRNGHLSGTPQDYGNAVLSIGESRSSEHGRPAERRDVFLHGYQNGFTGCQG